MLKIWKFNLLCFCSLFWLLLFSFYFVSHRIAASLSNFACTIDCKLLTHTVVSLKVTSGLFCGQCSPAIFILWSMLPCKFCLSVCNYFAIFISNVRQIICSEEGLRFDSLVLNPRSVFCWRPHSQFGQQQGKKYYIQTTFNWSFQNWSWCLHQQNQNICLKSAFCT